MIPIFRPAVSKSNITSNRNVVYQVKIIIMQNNRDHKT